ncbi:hypothetical protein MBRA_03720 [Methylobacterium brachiatum]|nr:hypothetical protein MBRA_03720 [Methylobacterium brachiatum]
MPVRVVDLLEAIEIEHQHRRWTIFQDRGTYSALQNCSVWQLSQGIEMRKTEHAFLDHMPLPDIAHDRPESWVAILGPGGQRQLDWELVTVLLPGDKFDGTTDQPCRRSMVDAAEVTLVAAAHSIGHQDRNGLPQSFGRRMPEQALGSRAPKAHPPKLVGADDGVGRGLGNALKARLRRSTGRLNAAQLQPDLTGWLWTGLIERISQD